MGLTTGLLALAMCGADPVPTPPVDSGEKITCEVQVLTVEGLNWRKDAYRMLKPAARQGSATIWTADRNLKAKLESAGVGKSIKAPKVSSDPNQVASITSDKMTGYVRHLGRLNVNETVSGTSDEVKSDFQPEVATVREGFSAVFSGQRYDQGVMAKVKFAESHIGTMHTVDLTQNIRVKLEGDATGVASQMVRQVFGTARGIPRAQVQIPEVFLSEIQGEWLVPNDGFLLISMGVNTVADAEGKAVVQERLAILDFATATPATATAMVPVCHEDENTAVAIENTANLSMPRVPDRSFPEAVDREGNVFELPPLPEAYASNELNQISPGSPLATPQSTPITRPRPMISDPQLARTSLEAVPDREIEGYNDPAACSTQPAGLATVIESFLRGGMTAAAPTDFACPMEGCPTQGCPFATECTNEPKASAPAHVEMGIRVGDGQGSFLYDAETSFDDALKNPGTAQVKHIPLGGKLSLQIEAKVVATPGMGGPTPASAPRPDYLKKLGEIDQKHRLLLLDEKRAR